MTRNKRKGTKRKNTSNSVTSGLYFSYVGSRPRRTDFLKSWQGRRGWWRKYSVQLWFQYLQGFYIYRCQNLFSCWLCWNSAAAMEQPVITLMGSWQAPTVRGMIRWGAKRRPRDDAVIRVSFCSETRLSKPSRFLSNSNVAGASSCTRICINWRCSSACSSVSAANSKT